MTRLNKMLVIDFEATCWPCRARRDEMEIIEIGYALCAVDRMQRFSPVTWGAVLVRPQLVDFSDYGSRLHGITAEHVADCPGLETAFNDLKCLLTIWGVKCLRDVTWASWGEWDHAHLALECERKELHSPLCKTHFNIKVHYGLQMRKLREQGGLRDAMATAGLQFEGREHSGRDDALNTARLLCRLLNDKPST